MSNTYLRFNFSYALRYYWPTHLHLAVVPIRVKIGQIRTLIHTKIYTPKKPNKQKLGKKKGERKRVWGGKKERKEGGKGPKRGRNGEKDGGKRKRGGWV